MGSETLLSSFRMIESQRQYKHIDSITAFFVAVLLISNIASTKIVALSFLTFDGGTLLFPLSYIFGDVLTEVYGFKRARKAIWLGFISALLMAFVFFAVGLLPAAEGWVHQSAYNAILGSTPRIVAASLMAYFAGSYTNSLILAKLKILTKGKRLWIRTIGSTVAGELADTLIFALTAFAGSLPGKTLLALIVSNYVFKVGVEVVFTPVTYRTVKWLKKAENEDYYDYGTKFSPF